MKYLIMTMLFFWIVFFGGCGDEKKALDTGKKLENLRVKICIQGCELKFGQCLDKILEGRNPTDPVPDGQIKIDACKMEFKTCSSDCLEMP